MFAVEMDGVIVILPLAFRPIDKKALDAYATGKYRSIFRVLESGVEYADVDQVTHEVAWLTAEPVSEE